MAPSTDSTAARPLPPGAANAASVDILDVALRIVLDPTERSVRGAVHHRFRAKSSASHTLELFADESVRVLSVHVLSGHDDQLRAVPWTRTGEGIRIDNARPWGRSPRTVVVEFASTPRDGLYFLSADPARSSEPHAVAVASVGQPALHRQWFPVRDGMAERWSSSVCARVEGRADWTVLASGARWIEAERDDAGRDGFACYRAESPHAPHALAVAAGPFACSEYVDGPSGGRSRWCAQYAEDLPTDSDAAVLADIEAEVARRMGSARPFPLLHHVVLDGLPVRGIENAAMPTYDRTAWRSQAGQVNTTRRASLVAHEVAHQWMGVSASASEPSDLWLHEAIATWCEVETLRSVLGGEAAASAWSELRRWDDSEPEARAPAAAAYSDAWRYLGAATYVRGAERLYDLQARVGDEALRRWLARLSSRRDGRAWTRQEAIAELRREVGTGPAAAFDLSLDRAHRKSATVRVRPLGPRRVELRADGELGAAWVRAVTDLGVEERPVSWHGARAVVWATQGAIRHVEVAPERRTSLDWRVDMPRRWVRHAARQGTTTSVRTQAIRELASDDASASDLRVLRDALRDGSDVDAQNEAAAALCRLDGRDDPRVLAHRCAVRAHNRDATPGDQPNWREDLERAGDGRAPVETRVAAIERLRAAGPWLRRNEAARHAVRVAARQWASGTRWRLVRAAYRLVAEMGESDDVDWLRTTWARAPRKWMQREWRPGAGG